MPWSRLILCEKGQVTSLIREARKAVGAGAPDGVGVFRSRKGFVLYFSPIATAWLRPHTQLALEECARPDDMDVEIAVGPDDTTAWYDLPAEEITAHLDLVDLDDSAMIGPDTDIDELRRVMSGRG